MTQVESARLLAEKSECEYLFKAAHRFLDEADRANFCFDQNTERSLIHVRFLHLRIQDSNIHCTVRQEAFSFCIQLSSGYLTTRNFITLFSILNKYFVPLIHNPLAPHILEFEEELFPPTTWFPQYRQRE